MNKVELMKFLSCMDAVFKLLHVEVARKAADENEKKKIEVEKFCGWVLQCKTEEEINKINFYKFIWVF